MKLKEIADITESIIETGDLELEITGAAGLDLATDTEISFLANPKYTPQLKTTNAGALLLAKGVEIERNDVAVLRSADPYLAFALALRAFFPTERAKPGIHPTAIVAESASVDAAAEIGAYAVVSEGASVGAGTRLMANVVIYKDAKIGRDTVLHSGVVVREGCEVGDNCIVHNNSTIGSDGFGYARTGDKKWLKIPQVGKVVVEDDVEIGANTAIDRASVGESRIKKGAKIDNLVQIGHSCEIGEDSLVCAQTGLAGSSIIGNRVILAGQVGIAGHLTVGDDVAVTAKSATSHDIEEGRVVSGIPAFDNKEWLRSTAAFRRLGSMGKILRELEKRIAELEEKDK